MSNDVNLLSAKESIVVQKKSLARLKTVSIVALLVTAAFSIALFFINKNIVPESLKTEQDHVLSNISLVRTKQAKLIVIQNRLQNISSILDKRLDYDNTINKILEKMPKAVAAERLNINRETVSMTVSSDSLLSLNVFIDSLTEMASRKEIVRTLTLDSLTLNESIGRYLVSLSGSL